MNMYAFTRLYLCLHVNICVDPGYGQIWYVQWNLTNTVTRGFGQK